MRDDEFVNLADQLTLDSRKACGDESCTRETVGRTKKKLL